MPLFNKRVITRAVQTIPQIAPDHREAVGHWAGMARSGAIRSHSEIALHGDFKARIVEGVLGYRPAGHPDGQTVAAEHAVPGGSVDLALGHFGAESVMVAPFELKGANTRDLDAPMPGRNITPVEQAWQYALAAGRGVRWVLVANYVELRLYAYREGNRTYERFDLSRLDDLEEYRRFVLLLSAENLLGERTLALLNRSRDADREVSDKLYQDYRALRERLIHAIAEANGGIPPADAIRLAQTILDRILFIAFAEDRDLLPPSLIVRAFETRNDFSPQPVWANFKGLFDLIDRGGQITVEGRPQTIHAYNGGLFRRGPEIRGLALPDEVCEGFREIGSYDFRDEIDVTILGHIFEQSISDIELQLKRARGEEAGDFRSVGRKKRDGIVYTPDYVARFIVEKTLGAHLDELFRTTMARHAAGGDAGDYDTLRFGRRRGSREERQAEIAAWRDYRLRLQTLRVVDPACGSGVFLVTAFDYLKREYDRVHKKLTELRGAEPAQVDIEDVDSEILSENLYGVDVNEESVEITRLSLWLKTAKRGKELDSLDHTIRVGDSIIEDSSFAYLKHGFNWKTAFPEVFAAGGFDVVLGNPPYVRMELLKQMKPWLEKRYSVVSDRADLYCYFYERGLLLLKPGGRLGFISSSTFFKTGSGRPLREFLLKSAAVETVTDFGDLQIFEGVTTYPVIMTMREGAPAGDHALRFWKLRQVPDDNFSAEFDAAATSYPQAKLGGGSWELEGELLRRLREKIVAGKPTLKEVYGPACRGVVTGLNEAFVVDRATRDRLVAEDPRSVELLKPWLEGKDLKRWRAEPRDLWIIYIPKNAIRIEDYPAIKAHLMPFKARLEQRATQQAWFELQQAQEAYVPAMQGPKIIYGHFQIFPIFSRDEKGFLSNNKTYFIPTQDKSLDALLNSPVLWFVFASRTTAVRGGWREATAQHIEPLPIPPTDDVAKSELCALATGCQAAAEDRYRRQQAVRRRLPDLCPPGRRGADGLVKLGRKLERWWELPDFAAFRAEVRARFKADVPLAERTDWEDWLAREKAEIARLTAEIERNEAAIDRIVYALFDLTPEEIKLLEDSISMTRTSP